MPPASSARQADAEHVVASDVAAWGEVTGTAYWLVKDTAPGTTMLQLRERWGPCQMACRFCPTSWTPRTQPRWTGAAQTPSELNTWHIEGIYREFKRHLAASPSERIGLISADILDYPDLDRLMDTILAAGKRVVLGTPGLALGDPGVIERLEARKAIVDVTFLTTDPAAYTAIVGHPEAAARIDRGLVAARGRLEVYAATVVTADNAADIDVTLRHMAVAHGARRVTLRLFYPDTATPPEGYFDLFPDMDVVLAAFDRLDAEGPSPTIILGNAPLCRFDPIRWKNLRVLPTRQEPHQNGYWTVPSGPCAACPAVHQCVRLHPEDLARHGVPEVDYDAVSRLMERMQRVGGDGLAIPPSGAEVVVTDGILPGEGILPADGKARGAGVPKGQGRPPGSGRLPGQGVLPGQGKLPGTGIPRELGKAPNSEPGDHPTDSAKEGSGETG